MKSEHTGFKYRRAEPSGQVKQDALLKNTTAPRRDGRGTSGPSARRSIKVRLFTTRRTSIARLAVFGRWLHQDGTMEHGPTEIANKNKRSQSIKYPRLVGVVRPPKNCTDHQNSQYGRGANPGWSVGPTQIRYCGSVERSGHALHPTSITLQLPIRVGPADHPRFSPPLSGGYRWSVQKPRGRTTRTTIGEVTG